MPQHPNQRNELYCQQRARGCLPAKAAIIAGYAAGSAIYSKMEEDPEILARIAEIMQENEMKREQQRSAARESGKKIGEMVGVGQAWVIAQLAENAQLARLDGDFKNSNDALKMIGDQFGMFKGGGEEEKNGGGNIPQTIDLDALKEITDSALPKEEIVMRDAKSDAERALRLISGGKNPKKDRDIATGSETDIAFTVNAMPPSEEEK